MRLYILSLVFLTSVVGFAQEQKLQLSGRVPVRGEVQVVKVRDGNVKFSSKDSRVKVRLLKRQPASIIEATAP